MDTLIHADIFFLITTSVVIMLGIIFSVILIYIAMILNNVRKISETVRYESGLLVEDVHTLRSKVREGSITLTDIFHFFRDLFTRKNKRKNTINKK